MIQSLISQWNFISTKQVFMNNGKVHSNAFNHSPRRKTKLIIKAVQSSFESLIELVKVLSSYRWSLRFYENHILNSQSSSYDDESLTCQSSQLKQISLILCLLYGWRWSWNIKILQKCQTSRWNYLVYINSSTCL